MMGFDEPIQAIVIGARNGVGEAFVKAICADHPENRVWTTSRTSNDSSAESHHHSMVDLRHESSIESLATEVKSSDFTPNLILNCSGLLHTPDFGPERSWRHLNIETMTKVFEVNAFGVSLLGKHLIPLLGRDKRTVFASLSARVGSVDINFFWVTFIDVKLAQTCSE